MLLQTKLLMCQHLWIEGPELPRRYGSCLSRVCTECGIYEMYTWHGDHLRYDYYVNAMAAWDEMEDV